MFNKISHALSQTDSLTKVLKSLVGFLVLFVALEFILLRVLMRMGPALPKSAATEAIFQWLIVAGEVAFNMAFLLSFCALVLIAVIVGNGRFVGLSMLIFCVLAIGLLFYVFSSPLVSLAYSILSFLVFVSALLIFRRQNGSVFIFLLIVTSAYFCSYYFKSASSVASLGSGASIPLASDVFSLGELLALIGAILVFFVFKPKWNPLAAIIASSVTIAFAAASVKAVWLPLVFTWAVSFTLHLHILIYVVALWLYVYVLVDLLGRVQQRFLAYGLLLIAFGGRML